MTTVAPPEAPEPSAPEPIRPGTLEIRGITKAFPNVQALTDISLDVHPGEILALMGENGAGKSTLLKILNGDYQPDSGSILLDGQPLSFSNPGDARMAGIRVIYQEPEIIPGVDVRSPPAERAGGRGPRPVWIPGRPAHGPDG
jgi:ABC-type sugar transport system ATPase subunit